MLSQSRQGFKDYLEAEDPDILVLTETKVVIPSLKCGPVMTVPTRLTMKPSILC